MRGKSAPGLEAPGFARKPYVRPVFSRDYIPMASGCRGARGVPQLLFYRPYSPLLGALCGSGSGDHSCDVHSQNPSGYDSANADAWIWGGPGHQPLP